MVNEYLTDNCSHLAASISFYLLFSMFPLILALVSVLGFVMRSVEVEAQVIKGISDFLPVSGDYIADSINRVVTIRGATGIIATIGLLWAGSSLFNAMRKSLNAAWGIKIPRPFLVERVLELGMMTGFGLLLLTSLSITTAINVMGKYSVSVWGLNFFNDTLFQRTIFTLLTITLAFIAFLFLYRLIPNTKVRWSDVWGGALLAAIGFEGAKQMFVWYTTNLANFNLIYGPVSAIIALLVWTYVSAVILLFCAKLTSVYSRRSLFFRFF